MENIPVIKLGLVAVSRDCFPIALSEKRRAAIAAKCGQKELNFVEIKTTVENEKDMCKAVDMIEEMFQCQRRFVTNPEQAADLRDEAWPDLMVYFQKHYATLEKYR